MSMTFAAALHPLLLELAVLNPQTCKVVSSRRVRAGPPSSKSLAMLILLAELSSRDDPFTFFTLSSVADDCAIDDSPDCRQNGNSL